MERMELLEELRRSFVLVSVTHAHKLKGDGLTREQRKTLFTLHGEAIAAFHDNSISFGQRRGVPKFMVENIMDSAGPLLVDLKKNLAGLAPEVAAEFAIGLRYEPVPEPEAFRDLPDKYRTGFTRLLVDGALRDYDRGMEEQLLLLHSAVARFVDRWTAFDKYIANPLKGERMLVRDSVAGSVATKARVLRAANVQGDPAVARFTAMAGFAATDPKGLRTDLSVRQGAIREATLLLDALRGYLGIGADGHDDVGEE